VSATTDVWFHTATAILQCVPMFGRIILGGVGIVRAGVGAARLISYVNLSKKSGLELTALRRLLRHAMTNGMFTEKTKDHVAHNSMSRILVEDPKTAAWVDLQTETIFLGGAHQCEALDRWPGSESKRETGASIGFHNPGQTSLYEEIKKKPEKIQKFGLAMELFSSGEGYEPDTLVEGYDWGKLGEGTVVDVSCPLIQYFTEKI
jgi:hypothetical protein